MNIENRKSDLINWLSNLNNEGLVNRIEELKRESLAKVPQEIISLLDSANSTESSKLIEHTNVRELLNK